MNAPAQPRSRGITVIEIIVAAIIIVVVSTTFLTLIGRGLYSLSKTSAMINAGVLTKQELKRISNTKTDLWLNDESGFYDGTDSRIIEWEDGRRYQINRQIIRPLHGQVFASVCSIVDVRHQPYDSTIALQVSTYPLGYGEIQPHVAASVLIPDGKDHGQTSLTINLRQVDEQGRSHPMLDRLPIRLNGRNGAIYQGEARNGCLSFIGLPQEHYHVEIEQDQWILNGDHLGRGEIRVPVRSDVNEIVEFELKKRIDI